MSDLPLLVSVAASNASARICGGVGGRNNIVHHLPLTMAVQILTDLHLEAPQAYDVFNILPKAPYLALLGGIGHTRKTFLPC
jgi:hypothetical protein